MQKRITGDDGEGERKERQSAEAEKLQFLLPLLLDSFADKDRESDWIRQACDCELLAGADTGHLCFAVIVTAFTDGKGEDKSGTESVAIVDEILERSVRHASCYLRGRVISLICLRTDRESETLAQITEAVVKTAQEIYGLTAQIGISRSVNTLSRCRQAYIEAMNALSLAQTGKNDICYIADAERAERLSHTEIQLVTGKIEKMLRCGTQRELELYLEELQERSRAGDKDSRILATILLSQILTSLYKMVFVVVGDGGIRKIQDELDTEHLLEMDWSAQNFQMVRQMCLDTQKLLLKQRKKSSEILCEQALRLVRDNYAQPDLSVMSISREIGISPNYLSTLIKKTTGHTLIEILTKWRIQKATALLVETDLKIREITELCGYKDQYYFSYCFKKTVGISPSAYRREHASRVCKVDTP